jgi:hypothetical protein
VHLTNKAPSATQRLAPTAQPKYAMEKTTTVTARSMMSPLLAMPALSARENAKIPAKTYVI